MSDARSNSDKSPSDGNGSLLDLTFDPSCTSTPSLRKPKLSEAEFQAALEFGFSGKYLPSSVLGGGGAGIGQTNTLDRTSGNRAPPQSASMINNHSNHNSNQSSGSQNQYPLFVDNYYNLGQEQQEGLLPPLRRPELNQIPPDVLAVLIKSARFEEVVIPTQRRLAAEVNLNNQQLHQQQQQLQQHPSSVRSQNAQEFSNTSNIGNSTNPIPSQSQQQSKSSAAFAGGSSSSVASNPKYNPFAKEFVPSSFQQTSSMNPQQSEDLAYAMSQITVQNQQNDYPSFGDEWDGSDCVLSTVTDMISQVSHDPASLNRCLKTTVNVLKKQLHDEDTLGIVVTLIAEQMISNPNFSYSGAKIFDALRENNIAVGPNSNIKKLVIQRMQEEFNHCLNNLDDPEVRKRALGVLRLLSELYMNFKVVAGGKEKFDLFALAVLELMQKLVDKDKSLETVKCVCQLLKLIGWEVENSENAKIREYFQLVMKELSYVCMTSDETVHRTCPILVDNLFKLRGRKWDREQEENPAPSTTVVVDTNPYSGKTSVYYDEVPESDDDSFGDDGAIMIDDEPEDVQAAYEEFLKMSSK